jgi:hypothetical protein
MPDHHEEKRALIKNNIIIFKVNPLEIPYPISIISFPSNAEVIINGIYKGTTPIIISDLPLGSHKLILKHSGYLDYETIIQAKSVANNLTFKLNQEPSILSNPYVISSIICAIGAIIAACYGSKKK